MSEATYLKLVPEISLRSCTGCFFLNEENDCEHPEEHPGCDGGIFVPMTSEPIELKRASDYQVEEGGVSLERVDKKYDQGKSMVGQMKKDFSKALYCVADVTRYGIEKYNQPGSWRHVENALVRYEDALGRHDLAVASGERRDRESKLLHAAHRAWNALATLELILETESDEDYGV